MNAPVSILLAALFCCILPNVANSQITPPVDAVSARQLLTEAKSLSDVDQDSLARERTEQAYNFFHHTPEAYPGNLGQAAYQLGQGLYKRKNFEEAQQRFEEAAKIWELSIPEDAARAADAVHYVSRCLFSKGKVEDALIACNRAYEMRQKLLPPKPCDLSESLRLMGSISIELGGYATAKQHYENAELTAKTCAGDESIEEADAMEGFGRACLRLGSYQEAIETQEKALRIRQKRLPPSHLDFSGSYMSLGEAYKNLNKFEEALFYYEKALEIQRRNTQEEDTNIAFAYSEIGQYYLAKQDYPKALSYFEKENKIMISVKDTSSTAYSYTCSDLARLYSALNDYPKAIVWYEKMVAIYRHSFKHPNTQLGSMLTHLGRSKLYNEDFEAALADFQEAKQIYEKILGPNNFLASKADLWLGNTYRKWYIKLGQDSLLEKSRTHYKLAVAGVETQLPKEHTATGQQKVLAEALPVFERAISAEVLNLKSHPNDPTALENAWQLSESAHSHQLLAATQEANARHFAGIPDAELIRDSLIQAQITALEKKRQSLLEGGGSLTDSLVLAQNAKIFNLKDEAQQLRTFFEKNYPDYFRLKYKVQTSSLAKTEQMLSTEQTLLEYFVGDFSIFVFVVQPGGSRVFELARDFPLNDWVEAFHEGISGYHTAAVVQKTDAQYQKTVLQYADAAQKLYEKLLAPIAESLTTEIIIVPGDGLSNLPFEALLAATPKDLSNFNTYPFLLRSHTVQYAYSATMLHQMTARQHPQAATNDLLAFAPFFEEDTTSLAMRLERDGAVRLGLSALPFSGEEVIRAKKRYGGQSAVLTGKMATKEKFVELAAKYKVLHLATHGKANHLAGDFSYLAFASQDENVENGLLSVGELYNLKLNADLVLLSACETGIGEQQRGEGVVSLARAFAFAGAKSIVASLWSVNDKSTMQVMDNFYAELKSGKTKNIALANAKRQYLEKNPGQMHPFYWAAFVAVGDMAAIKN